MYLVNNHLLQRKSNFNIFDLSLLQKYKIGKEFSCLLRIRFFISKSTIISLEKQNQNLPWPFLSPSPTSSHPSHLKSHTHFFPEFDFPSSKKEDFVDTKFLKWMCHNIVNQSLKYYECVVYFWYFIYSNNVIVNKLCAHVFSFWRWIFLVNL